MLVGVGWKRAPRFPGMPASEQGRESLSELVELARSASIVCGYEDIKSASIGRWRSTVNGAS